MIELTPRIVIDENIMFGQPIIKGTRVPVKLVLSKLSSGMSLNELMDGYGISWEDVLAVLQYTIEVIDGGEVVLIP